MSELHFFSNNKFAVKSEHFTPRAGDKVIEIKPSELCRNAEQLRALSFLNVFAQMSTAHSDFSWYLAAMAGDYGKGFAANKQAHFDYLISDRPLKIVFFKMEVPDVFKIKQPSKTQKEPTQGGFFKECCAKHMRSIYVDMGINVWGNTVCPDCGQFIGFSPSSPEYVDDFLTSFGLEPLFKSNQ